MGHRKRGRDRDKRGEQGGADATHLPSKQGGIWTVEDGEETDDLFALKEAAALQAEWEELQDGGRPGEVVSASEPDLFAPHGQPEGEEEKLMEAGVHEGDHGIKPHQRGAVSVQITSEVQASATLFVIALTGFAFCLYTWVALDVRAMRVFLFAPWEPLPFALWSLSWIVVAAPTCLETLIFWPVHRRRAVACLMAVAFLLNFWVNWAEYGGWPTAQLAERHILISPDAAWALGIFVSLIITCLPQVGMAEMWKMVAETYQDAERMARYGGQQGVKHWQSWWAVPGKQPWAVLGCLGALGWFAWWWWG